MEKPLKDRQIYLFFIAFMPVIKLFELPGLLAKYANEDMWISASISCILDVLTLALILLICKDQDFYSILKVNFGKTVAKIIMLLYALMFLLKAVTPINEQREFVELTLYETLPNPLNFFPFFLVSLFLSLKKLRVIGRCSEIMWFITAVGIVLLIFLSIESTDFHSVLPIGANGINNTLKAVYRGTNWFGDCIYMLFFMGKFEKKKNSTFKIVGLYALSSAVVILFMIVFYGIFTHIAFRQPFALTKISKYATAVNNTGRFDYIGIMFVVFSQIFAVALPLYFATYCLNKVFNFKSKLIPALICNGLVFIITAFFHQYFKSIEHFISSYGGIIFILFCNVFPVLTIFLRKKEKKNALNLA